MTGDQSIWIGILLSLISGALGSLLSPRLTSLFSRKDNRELNNYTLYNQKRHEIYPKIYQLLVKIITYQSDPRRYEYFAYIKVEDMSIDELNDFLDKFNFINQLKKDEMIIYFKENNFDTLNKRIDSFIRSKKQQEYVQAITELRDYYTENECYFSESLGKSVTEIVDLLWELYTKYRRKGIYSEDRYFNDERAISKVDKIDEKIDLVYEKIRNKVLQVKYSIQSELKEF